MSEELAFDEYTFPSNEHLLHEVGAGLPPCKRDAKGSSRPSQGAVVDSQRRCSLLSSERTTHSSLSRKRESSCVPFCGVSVFYVWHQIQRAKKQCFQGAQRFVFSGRADAFQMQIVLFQMTCSYGENYAVFRPQIACVPLFSTVRELARPRLTPP